MLNVDAFVSYSASNYDRVCALWPPNKEFLNLMKFCFNLLKFCFNPATFNFPGQKKTVGNKVFLCERENTSQREREKGEERERERVHKKGAKGRQKGEIENLGTR